MLQVAEGFGAREHWAKIELADSEAEREKQRKRLKSLYPVEEFKRVRRELDPKNVFGNDEIDALLG